MSICKFEDCEEEATVGKYGAKTLEYCNDHKPKNYNKPINICRDDFCMKSASFGEPGDGKLIFCAKHKTKGMISKKIPKLCEIENCNKQATWMFPYETPTRCKNHKNEFQINKKYNEYIILYGHSILIA